LAPFLAQWRLFASPVPRWRRTPLRRAPGAQDARARRCQGDAAGGMRAEIGIEVDADEAAAEPARGDAGGAGAGERVEHDVAGEALLRHSAEAVHGDEAVGQRLRERRWMAVEARHILGI